MAGDVNIPSTAEQLKELLVENERLRAERDDWKVEAAFLEDERDTLKAKLDALRAMLTSETAVTAAHEAYRRDGLRGPAHDAQLRVALAAAVDAVLSLPVPGDHTGEAMSECTTADCGRVAELEAYIDIDDDDATAGWFPYCGSCGHALAIYPQRSLNSPSDPISAQEKPRLVVDWTEDGQGIVLDTRTVPATVVGTHDEPSNPASVLSRLLESDREGTVRALEGLLTGDGQWLVGFRCKRCGSLVSFRYGGLLKCPVFQPSGLRDYHDFEQVRLVPADCRALLNVERRVGDPDPTQGIA
jgi:hypothetical protein